MPASMGRCAKTRHHAENRARRQAALRREEAIPFGASGSKEPRQIASPVKVSVLLGWILKLIHDPESEGTIKIIASLAPTPVIVSPSLIRPIEARNG